MTSLAAIEGQLLVFLLIAVFGFINWLSGKLNPGDKKTPPVAPAAPKRRSTADSEEERMRRFMEALGLPTGEMPSPPVVAPSETARRARPLLAPAAPPPIPPRPKPRPATPPPPPIPDNSFDELPAPIARVEILPELAPTERPEYATVSSRISATPRGASTQESAPLPTAAPIHEMLRAALASPQQLRSAFILREVLGPPLALRN